MTATMQQAQPNMQMQGIVVPASSVDPKEFFRRTRRLTVLTNTRTFAGLGLTDTISILQTGIVAALTLRFVGSLVVTPGTGTVASTARWPFDLFRRVRFSANGQSNLVNCSGGKLKARDIMARGDLSSKGVTAGFGGASPGTSRSAGTLLLASESPGVGTNVSAIGAGTYPVDFSLFVPVAFDQVNLLGAIFAQTASTDLNLAIDWANTADVFALTGNATVALTGSLYTEAVLYSIPQGPNGDVIVPDLSMFHSLIETRYSTPSNGVNEIRLAGQGLGRQLLRVFYNVWSGATSAPLACNDTNVGQVGWRYGGNDTPELYPTGQIVRYQNERWFNDDLGALYGFIVHDFASENAFRDSVDEGAATELRLVHEIPSALSLTSPFVEYVQETAFAGAVGA